MDKPVSKRLIFSALTLVAGITVCMIRPPFTIVLLQAARDAEEEAKFDPEEFAGSLWTDEFPLLADSATGIVDVVRALKQDAKNAAEEYGRVWGLGGSTYFLVQGVGRIAKVDEDRLEITINGDDTELNIVLLTDHLFGNALRNASGLIDPSDFSNSRELNNLSTALNAIVTSEVLPKLRESAVEGREIHFLGCAEIQNVHSISKIEIIPISAGVVSEEGE